MSFFNPDLRTYIEPKNEIVSYIEKLKKSNLLPLPSRLIYTPIIHPELIKKVNETELCEIPSIYPMTKSIILKNNILFSQGLMGAPATGILLEEFIALGINEIIFLGLAGSIQNLSFGEKIIVKDAVRLEGTSYHYLPENKTVTPSENFLNRFIDFVKKRDLAFTEGTICSIDAPFRETYSLVTDLRKRNVLGIEMEISAVYAIARFRKIKALAIVVISDLLNDQGWSKFRSREFTNSFLSCYDYLIEFFTAKK